MEAVTAHLSPREWTAVPVEPTATNSRNLEHLVDSDKILRLLDASRTRFHTNNIRCVTPHLTEQSSVRIRSLNGIAKPCLQYAINFFIILR